MPSCCGMKKSGCCLFKSRINRVCFHFRVEVAIAAAHGFGLVTNDVVDDALVNTLVGERRNEAVTEYVIASELPPFRMRGERVLQVVVGLVASQWAKGLLHAGLAYNLIVNRV